MSKLEKLRQGVIDAELRFQHAKVAKDRAERDLVTANQTFHAWIEEFKLSHDLWKTAQRELDEATRKEARVL